MVEKKTIKKWWAAFIILLLLTLVAEFFITPHPHFGIDGTLFFNAWYGFLSCAGIVVASKLLGFILKRKTNYYEGENDA